MNPDAVVGIIVVSLFVLFLLGILINVTVTTSPIPRKKKLRGADAILDAIDRFDRLQRQRMYRVGGVHYFVRMAPRVFFKKRRRVYTSKRLKD